MICAIRVRVLYHDQWLRSNFGGKLDLHEPAPCPVVRPSKERLNPSRVFLRRFQRTPSWHSYQDTWKV